MSDIRINRPGCDGEGERGKRGKRGKRGHRGHDGATGATGATGPTITLQDDGVPVPGAPHNTQNFIGAGVQVTDAGGGVADITIPGGPQFIPERTLFVAQSWPAGSDPLVFFTTISAALVQAATLSPTAANPIEILVYPGTYSDALSLAGNVHLVGAGQQRSVIISGPVTWAPTTPGTQENLNLAFLTFTGSFTIDTTGKLTGAAQPVGRGLIFSGGFNFQGSPTAAGVLWIACVFVSATTFNNVSVSFLACLVNAVADFTGSTSIRYDGIMAVAPVFSDTSSGQLSVPTIPGVTNNSTGIVTISGAISGSLAGTGPIDVRGSNYGGNGNLAGPGTINRTTFTESAGPTTGVALSVLFAVPYPDNLYNVSLQLTAGPGDPAAKVIGKAFNGFMINTTVAGNTYEFIVNHD
jgi:hypothetical protein